MNLPSKIVLGALALVVAIALAVGAWHLGWLAQSANQDRRTEINDRSYARQQALLVESTRLVSTVSEIDSQIEASPDSTKTLSAQRRAIVAQACEIALKLTAETTQPQALKAFISKECS